MAQATFSAYHERRSLPPSIQSTSKPKKVTLKPACVVRENLRHIIISPILHPSSWAKNVAEAICGGISIIGS